MRNQPQPYSTRGIANQEIISLAALVITALLSSLAAPARAQAPAATEPAPSTAVLPFTNAHRLYDDLGVFIINPDGKDFTLRLDVRDINHMARGPAELLVKVYTPDGKLAVREVVPDDGVSVRTGSPQVVGWDHDAWYYATCYSRGLEPGVRWSAWSDPVRLAHMPMRTFNYSIKGGQKGVYRMILAGSPDHFVSISNDQNLKWGVNGGPDWIQGHHSAFRRKFFYAPKGATGLSLSLMEFDQPASRRAVIKTLDGKVVEAKTVAVDKKTKEVKEFRTALAVDARSGMSEARGGPWTLGEFEDKVFVLEVSDGPGDYLLDVNVVMPKEQRNWRGVPRVGAVLCDSEADARATLGGAIYHDGQTFWQGHQVRLYDWLKKLKPDELVMPQGLPVNKDFVSVGSHESPMEFLNTKRHPDVKDPKPGTADIVMFSYSLHQNPIALNVAIREMLEGMLLIGPNDHVMHGRNMAYEMGTYSFFYHRPAWRIIQESKAPPEVKEIVREFAIQVGDRLAFCRGIEMVNGNSLSSLIQGMRYCVEATGDPLQRELFDTYWERFTTGGFGSRVGVGPSGGVQEGFGYDAHYGTYVLGGWPAGIADLNETRFTKVLANLRELYSYTAAEPPHRAYPWSSRTAAGPRGDPLKWTGALAWKGHGGPNITGSVRNANEFFYARRPSYYVVSYAGRITPTWLGEGMHGQVGFGGGVLAQLHIPGTGIVLASTLQGDYGGGTHVSNWRNFHIHSLVGTAADGTPIVTANSEPFAPRLDGNTLAMDAEVRQSCVHFWRTYTFGDDAIAATVRLGKSTSERVYDEVAGTHGLRGSVSEAYEMIPYAVRKVNPGKRQDPVSVTRVLRLAADGSVQGPVTDQPVTASGIIVDSKGYGMRIDLDVPRPVLLGKRDTVLIQLAGRVAAPAGKNAGNKQNSAGESAAAGEADADSETPESTEETEADEGGDGEAEESQSGGPVLAASIALTYKLSTYVGEPPAHAVDAKGVASTQPSGNTAPRSSEDGAVGRSEEKLLVLPAVASADKVAAALEKAKAFKFPPQDGATGEIRVALAGDQLAVWAIVSEPSAVTRTNPVWKGSCIEVFGSPAGGSKISQLFIAPKAGDAPAAGFTKGQGKAIDPAPSIQVASAPRDKGYAIQALIPLSLLGLDATADSVLLEFQLDANGLAAKGKPAMVYTTLFGSKFAYQDSTKYALMKINRGGENSAK